MARGLTREQLGVTESMIATYGEAIFRMRSVTAGASGSRFSMLR